MRIAHHATATTPGVAVTAHADARLRQRGYRAEDLDLILSLGTEGAEGVVLTNADAQREINRMKRHIHRLERLRGTAVIMADGTVVSVYRPESRIASRSRPHFHRPDCAWAMEVSYWNLMVFEDREAAIAAGLRPCKTCCA